MMWTYNLLLIAFSISLLSILRSIIEWKDLRESYDGLFDFEIIIEDNFMKWAGQ